MNKWMVGMASGMLAVGTIVPVAMAATTNTKAQSSNIVVNNEKIASPAVMQSKGSTYVPVWYVMKALQSIGLQSKWTGSSWLLSTSNAAVSPTAVPKPVMGQVVVYLNGSKLMSVPTIVATDPASHKPTTYLHVADVTTILQKADVFANWTSGAYQIQTPTVKALADAYQNTQNSSNTQMTGDITEQLHFTLKQNSQSNSQSSTGNVPQDMTMEMKITAQTGTVSGSKSALVTITPKTFVSSGQGGSLPNAIQEYIQGSRLWLNQGQGWVEQTNSEQLIQSLQSQLPLDNVNFSVLRSIESSVTGTATEYTARLDTTALANVLSPVMSSIANTTTSSGTSSMSPSQLASLLNNIIKQTKGSIQITVQPIDGQSRVTSEQLTLDMSIPMSTLVNQIGSASEANSSASSTRANEIQSISIHETVSADYTYLNTPIVPPTGIDTSSTSTGQ